MSPMVVAAQCDQCSRYASTVGQCKDNTHPPEGWVERWERLVKGDISPSYRRTFCSSDCLLGWVALNS